jgi:hypothetical protein
MNACCAGVASFRVSPASSQGSRRATRVTPLRPSNGDSAQDRGSACTWAFTRPSPVLRHGRQLPRTSVEDTVLDLVSTARTFDDAYSWISNAVGRGCTTPELLSKALAGRSRIRWRAWVTPALADAADGVHSPLERHYVSGVERVHGLPTAQRQAKRRHGSGTRYLDNLYARYGVCVELDGAVAHPAEGRWRDTRRDNANLVQGVETLRYGWPDATLHRCRTAAEIGALLRRHGWKVSYGSEATPEGRCSGNR